MLAMPHGGGAVAPRKPVRFDSGGGSFDRPAAGFDSGGGSFGGSPKPAPVKRTAAVRAAVSGGSGGGGAAKTASIAAVAPTVDLDTFINNDPSYVTAKNAGDLNLQDYDADTLRQQQQTQAQVDSNEQLLKQQLLDLHNSTAESYAARGIERSGLQLGAQDQVDEQGVRQDDRIRQTLTDLLTNRSQGRLTQEQKNRAALDQVMQQITGNYYKQQQAAS